MITDTQLQDFCDKIQEMKNEYFSKHFSNISPPVIYFERGKKYARIVSQDKNSTQRRVFCFVSLQNVQTKNLTAKVGDILKAATWNAPAKHARGNILGEEPLNGVSQWGANYLR